jgi:hypothetical protein
MSETASPKLWKRAEGIVRQCQSGKQLCKFNRTTEAGGTEVVFFLEPGGKKVGARSAENAIKCGALIPSNDGLFGEEFSQTWSAAQ